jgi:hypothetical protein
MRGAEMKGRNNLNEFWVFFLPCYQCRCLFTQGGFLVIFSDVTKLAIIMEYSSLRDFGHRQMGLFLYEDF